ncbi:MAG TPA: hypothetical protein VFF30_12365 [Nitrososphaerales archaeon]|nr:hypothetical protein [Nitrososphaerales archaeon]
MKRKKPWVSNNEKSMDGMPTWALRADLFKSERKLELVQSKIQADSEENRKALKKQSDVLRRRISSLKEAIEFREGKED